MVISFAFSQTSAFSHVYDVHMYVPMQVHISLDMYIHAHMTYESCYRPWPKAQRGIEDRLHRTPLHLETWSSRMVKMPFLGAMRISYLSHTLYPVILPTRYLEKPFQGRLVLEDTVLCDLAVLRGSWEFSTTCNWSRNPMNAWGSPYKAS